MRPINIFFLFLLGIFVTSLIVGCTPNNSAPLPQDQPQVPDQSNTPVPAVEGQNGPPNPTGPSSGRYGAFNNTVDREAMRLSSIAACNGMNVNDTCQLTFGNRTMNGTCRSFNDTLSCSPTGSIGGRMRGNGNYTRYQGAGPTGG